MGIPMKWARILKNKDRCAILYTFDETLEDATSTIPWFSLKDNERRRVRLMLPPGKMPSVLEHQFRNEGSGWYRSALCLNNKTGPHGCPECRRGNAPKRMVYLILWDYAMDPPQLRVWERTESFVRKNIIDALEGAGYDLTQTDLFIHRSGVKLATRFTITPAPADTRVFPPDDITIEASFDTVEWDTLLKAYPSLEDYETFQALASGEQTPPPVNEEAARDFGVSE